MSTELAFAAPHSVPTWQRWLIYSPAARIILFVASLLIAEFGCGWLVHALPLPPGATTAAIVNFTFRALLPLGLYLGFVRLVEQRRLVELSVERALPGLLLGLLGGVALFSAVVGTLWLLGSYHVLGFQRAPHWAGDLLVVGFGAAIGEEIVFRGVLYRISEEGLGSWAALGLSALLFGALHLGNPGATLWSSAAIAIEAGLLLALIYLVSRSLWPCIGLHAAWNFTQGTLYGIPVSGMQAHGWLVSRRSGPDWLSGGRFGAEASVVALGLCVAVSALLLATAIRRGRIVPPAWKRRTR